MDETEALQSVSLEDNDKTGQTATNAAAATEVGSDRKVCAIYFTA